MSYKIDYSKVRAIYIYLELRSSRMLVGKLERMNGLYVFSYEEKYLNYKNAIPLGPEFPLTRKCFESERIFPSLWDRIPSKDNPAYAGYCKLFGIDPTESNVIILLATIASKGPSSFVFVPTWEDSFSGQDLKAFRLRLGLTTRAFSLRFGLGQSTVIRIENNKTKQSEMLKLLEILHEFPEAEAYHAKKYNAPGSLSSFTSENLKIFRSNLGLTIRDFATCFGISPVTVISIEKGRTKGVVALRLLEILHEFPEAACYYIEKYGGSLHSKIKNKVLGTLQKQFGGWADVLREDEFIFSKEAAEALKTVVWAKKFLKGKKIEKALNYIPGTDPYREDTRSVKASLFEVRFAYAIHKAGLTAEYEYKAGVDKSSVDFRILSQNKQDPEWLVELTSLGDSDAVKENTVIQGNFYSYSSSTTPWDTENSPEVRDLIKVQQAILGKVKEKKGIDPIKFPEVSIYKGSSSIYHVIIVDIRGFNGGASDFGDYMNVLYGSQGLDDFYKRVWIAEDGTKELLKGILDTNHPDPRSKILQARVHAIGFISEKVFNKNEIMTQLKLYPNLQFTNVQEIRDLWPLRIR